MTITMRNRSKNRKPTQRGRYLSTEAIQAVQSLKRAALRGGPAASSAAAVEPKLRRLLKADMVAVFRELAAQGEALLALQVRRAMCAYCFTNRAYCFFLRKKVAEPSFFFYQIEPIGNRLGGCLGVVSQILG